MLQHGMASGSSSLRRLTRETLYYSQAKAADLESPCSGENLRGHTRKELEDLTKAKVKQIYPHLISTEQNSWLIHKHCRVFSHVDARHPIYIFFKERSPGVVFSSAEVTSHQTEPNRKRLLRSSVTMISLVTVRVFLLSSPSMSPLPCNAAILFQWLLFLCFPINTCDNSNKARVSSYALTPYTLWRRVAVREREQLLVALGHLS